MKHNELRIVLTGGVSGGHTFPLIAVANALKAKSTLPVVFRYIGSRGRFETEAMAAAGIETRFVQFGKWRRYFSFQNFIDPFRIPIGFVQALWHLLWFMPDVVFSKGGSASVPVVLACFIYHIPVLIHDSDARAGRANRFLAHFAKRVAIAYEDARSYFPPEKTLLTGNPVRPEFLQGHLDRALERFHLRADHPVLLVLGGSQGAQKLNTHVVDALPDILAKEIQVVHQTGEAHLETVKEAARSLGVEVEQGWYHPVGFVSAEEIADLLQASQVVLSRAGASSIAEIAAAKKAAILVPLSSAANDEQRQNAYEVARAQGAIVLEEANLGKNMLVSTLESLFTSETLRAKLESNIASFYKPDAADLLAQALLDLATR